MQGCGRGGANKGQAGDLGDACLAGPRRRSRRFPLSARGMREEGDGPGAWGRAGSGKTRALAERASGVVALAGGPEAR